MRALVYDHPRGPVRVAHVTDPEVPADGVVVAVHATGLCRSDWHAWAGHEEVASPHIPGHELAGVVAEVGSAVQRWSVGDRVTVPFVQGCGTCAWCHRGDAQVCPRQRQAGFTHDGSFAELVALGHADSNLVAVPNDIALTTAAALGCRFATAYRGLVARARLQPGEWVSVIGAGGVGLSTVMIATAIGARTVVVDPSPPARALAADLGATHVLDTTQAGTVAALTDGGTHVSVDAYGSAAAAATAIGTLRRRGRHVQIGLLPGAPSHPRIPMDRVIAWELDLLGSHGMAAVDYPELLALLADGTLAPQRLLDRVVGLDDAARLLPAMDTAAGAGITMIDPRE